MKVKTLSALAGLGGALILSGTANAAYTGLSVVDAGVHATPVGNRQVWRLYATFSNANDYLTGVNGGGLGAMVIQTRNSTDSAAGTNFFNPGSAATGNTSPEAADGNLQWGTFATIGVSLATQGSGPSGTPDLTSLSPGFPNFINGASITNSNMGWFTAGPVEQGRAGYAADGDAPLRVLVAQLSVNVGENVRGTMNVAGVNDSGLAGGQSFLVGAQTFNSVPAPGALALLGLAGLVGSRRRRG